LKGDIFKIYARVFFSEEIIRKSGVMAKKYIVRLSAEERGELESLVKKG
jgi:hypothetical protein